MAKTKIDDLPKGAEEMNAEEQKAAKGGATAVEFGSLAASQVRNATLAKAAVAPVRTSVRNETGTLPTLDPSIRPPTKPIKP